MKNLHRCGAHNPHHVACEKPSDRRIKLHPWVSAKKKIWVSSSNFCDRGHLEGGFVMPEGQLEGETIDFEHRLPIFAEFGSRFEFDCQW